MTRRRQRNDEAAGRRAQAAALAERVRPQPAAEPVDIATQVRDELDRQRIADREDATRRKIEALSGGPCWACGRNVCARSEEGSLSPAWSSSAEGAQCGVCTEWRETYGGTEFLDVVAHIAITEGLAGLRRPVRSQFLRAPGLAGEVGLIPWRDSGHPPGSAWSHVDVERLRAFANAPDEPVPGPTLIEHPAGCWLCGTSSSVAWHERQAGEPYKSSRGDTAIRDPQPVTCCALCESLTIDRAAARLTGLRCVDGVGDAVGFFAFGDSMRARPDPNRRFAYLDIDEMRARARELYPNDRDWERPALRHAG